MDSNKRPDDMVRITTKELADKFIEEQIALLRQQMNYDEPNWKKRQSNSPSALPDEQAG